MLTSCVHANLPHLKPVMFDVFCSFLLILLFGHAGPLLLCVGFSAVAGSEDYSLVAVCELHCGFSCCVLSLNSCSPWAQ